MPNAGYRLVKGYLKAAGHHVKWKRIRSVMQRIDGPGIVSRMTRLGCVARRAYSVPSPLSLVHIDTNHKLIRIERLWRDVWSGVTCQYYSVLHSLEEDGLLDLSSELHLFLVHYVFLPRLQSDLKQFLDCWNSHPIRTESNLTPDQLWYIGMLQSPSPVSEPEPLQTLQGLSNIRNFTQEDPDNSGIVVPHIRCPLSDQDLTVFQAAIDPTKESASFGRDIYTEALQLTQVWNNILTVSD
ncbi:hypothetical protein MHYP_G00361960 [Metynnis hypsauchen]